MIDMNTGGFKQHLDFFVTESQNNKIGRRSDTFTESNGWTIERINSCLDSYSDFCGNVDTLYHSTMLYLQKAYYNISSCESDNSV